jgi:putative hydrolase of the HAD superfamily
VNDRSRTSRNHRLVLFDLDNTLCDHFTSLHVRLHHAFEESFPNEDERTAVVAASVEAARDGTEHFASLLAAHDVADRSAVERAVDRFLSDRYRGLELFDDALEVIATASEYFEIAMITNGPTDIQQPKLDLLGIEPLFSFVLISESTGFWKPDPRIFEIALERAGVPAHCAVYIGDSPDHDMAGARAAGLSAVWMNRRGLAWPGGRLPDYEARNLRDALRWLGVQT